MLYIPQDNLIEYLYFRWSHEKLFRDFLFYLEGKMNLPEDEHREWVGSLLASLRQQD